MIATYDRFQKSGELIKAIELIEVSGATHLTAFHRKVYNTLLSNAFGKNMLVHKHVHSIPYATLMGNYYRDDRVESALEALQDAKVNISISEQGGVVKRRVQLLGGVDIYYSDKGGKVSVSYSFDVKLLKILKHSKIFAVIDLAEMNDLNSKYGLALYELICRRASLRNVFWSTFNISDLRDFLGVKSGVMGRYADFNRKVIKVAVDDVNKNTRFNCNIAAQKKVGRRVSELKISWALKSIDERRSQWAQKMDNNVDQCDFDIIENEFDSGYLTDNIVCGDSIL